MNHRQPTTGFVGRRFVRSLVRLLLRAEQPADYLARGVFFGLLIGLTPTVGVQFLALFLVWLFVHNVVPRWDFHLVVALGSSCVTNVVTAPVFYYLFVVTGRVILGRWDRLRGYETFEGKLRASLDPDGGWFEVVWTYLTNVVAEFGLPMIIGCIPWALLGSWLGYRWSLKLVTRYRARRERRRKRRSVEILERRDSDS